MRKKILLPLCAALCLAGAATASAGSAASGNDLQTQYDDLLKKYNTLQAEYDELLEKYNALSGESSGGFELSTGTYVVGEDIQAGKYDISVLDGFGTIKIWESLDDYNNGGFRKENYYLSASDGDTVSNARLYDGYCVVVDSGLDIFLTDKDAAPQKAVQESQVEEPASSDAITLSAGYYIIGNDIPEGEYNLNAVHGNGAVSISNAVGDINTYLMAEEKSNLHKTLPGSYKVSLDEIQLTKGYSLIIADSLIVEFTAQ